MLALSVHQPFAEMLVRGLKLIEYRSRPLPRKYVGQRVYIQAGKTFRFRLNGTPICNRKVWELAKTRRGGIVGEVTFARCVEVQKGDYHWHVTAPIVYPEMIPCKGRLGFFRPEVPQ